MNFEAIKQKNDLLLFVGRDTTLKHVANTMGGEWAGPCPFCGGRDRFRVQPNHPGGGRWMCRQCSEHWGDITDYLAKRENVDLKTAYRLLAGDAIIPARAAQRPKANPAYEPPSSTWQERGRAFVEYSRQQLSKNEPALDYLHQRGLTDKTIERYQLGYNPEPLNDKPERWGLDCDRVFIQAGIVIPCFVGRDLWYLKIRSLPGSSGKLRYTCVTGSKTAAIYGADDLAGANQALFCEGEFNAMIFNQQAGDVIPAVTFGSATNRPDLATWGAYFLPLNLILAEYDSDQAGESGALALFDLLGDVVKLTAPPENVKDLNDYYLAGGNIWNWIKNELDFHDPIGA